MSRARGARCALFVIAAATFALAAAKPAPEVLPVDQCRHGIYACESWSHEALEDDDDATECAPYNRDYKKPSKKNLKPMVILSAIVMCAMAYGVGANDASNSWATAVGSGAIGLSRATIICGIFDVLGAVSLGAGVSGTISKGTSDITEKDCFACGFCDSQITVYALGMLGALVGATIFLLVATFSAVPVSTTHAIVGGVVGMTMAATSASCVTWGMDGMTPIFIAWVASPALAGVVSAAAFYATEYGLVRSANPLGRTRAALPWMYAACTFAVAFVIGFKKLAEYMSVGAYVGLAAGLAVLSLVGAYVANCKYLEDDQVKAQRLELEEFARNKALALEASSVDVTANARDGLDAKLAPTLSKTPSLAEKSRSYLASSMTMDDIDDFRETQEETRRLMGHPMTDAKRDAIYLFRYLLVFTAVLKSFMHGANDTANATAAFSAVVGVSDNGLKKCEQPPTPTWIMLVAGLFVCLGVYTLGYKVIETVGRGIARVDFHTAWTIEFGTVTAVAAATVLNIPVSTTHCQVGAVAAVGAVSLGMKAVQWGQLGKIVVSWIVTLPAAGIVAAIILWVFRPTICASCPWS